MRSCLPFVASGSAGKGSTYRWQWSGRLGFTSRFKLGRSFLTWCRNVCHFIFFLRTGRIIASVPVPSFFLLVPLKDGRWALFPGIR